MEKIEWLNYGFEYDEGTKSNYPIILSDNISTKQRPLPPENDPPQKRSKLNPKSKEQIEILEKEFLNCNYLNDKSLEELINITGLAKLKYKIGFLENGGIVVIKKIYNLLKFHVFLRVTSSNIRVQIH